MDIAKFLDQHWQVISSSPLPFVLFAVIIVAATFALTRVLLNGALEASRERLGGAKEEIARLQGEKGELIKRLETHGEDIATLKKDLAALPRIHVSDQPPDPNKPMRDGDIWVQYDGTEAPQEK